jgi:hypothetical protein
VQQPQEALRPFDLDAPRGAVEHEWGHVLAACRFGRRRRRALANAGIGRNGPQLFVLVWKLVGRKKKRKMSRPHLVRCGIRRGGNIGGAPATATGSLRHGRAPRLLGLRERPLPEGRLWAPRKTRSESWTVRQIAMWMGKWKE